MKKLDPLGKLILGLIAVVVVLSPFVGWTPIVMLLVMLAIAPVAAAMLVAKPKQSHYDKLLGVNRGNDE